MFHLILLLNWSVESPTYSYWFLMLIIRLIGFTSKTQINSSPIRTLSLRSIRDSEYIPFVIFPSKSSNRTFCTRVVIIRLYSHSSTVPCVFGLLRAAIWYNNAAKISYRGSHEQRDVHHTRPIHLKFLI